MKNSWPFFALAAVIVFITPFPGLAFRSVLGGSGTYFIAKIILLFAILSVGGAVNRGSLQFKAGVCLCAAAYLLTGAFAYSSLESLRYLLPLPILGLIQFYDMPDAAEDSPLAPLPPVLRQLAAGVLAMIGAGMLVGSLITVRIEDGFQLEYLQLFIGWIAYGASLLFLLTGFSRRAGVLLVISSYCAALTLFALGITVEMAGGRAHGVSDPDLIVLLVIAMLLIQAWRHFDRPEGWLKILETAIGGFAVALAGEFVVETLKGLGGWAPVVGIFYLPLLAPAAAVVYFGLWMIWSDELYLGRLFRRRA